MKLRGLALIVVGFGGLAGLGGIAAAQQPSPELGHEFQAGVDAFRLGKYKEARTHLEQARALAPKLPGPHRFLAAVAQAERNWDDCVTSARAALALNPRSQELAETRKLHDDCRVAAGRPPFRGELGEGAALSVVTNVPASLKIRGLAFGGTPMAPRPIAAGKVTIEVEKVGYRSVQLEVDALPGIVTDVTVELDEGESTLTQGAVRAKAGALVMPAGHPGWLIQIDGVPVTLEHDRIELVPGVHVVDVRAQGKDPWRRRIAITGDGVTTLAPELVDSGPREHTKKLGLALAGGGLGFLAVGLGAFYASRSAAEDATDIALSETQRVPGDPPLHTRADFEDARSRYKRWSLVSNLSYGVGLAAAGAGIYVWLRHRTPSEDAPAFAIAPISGGAVVTRTVAW